MRRRHWSASGTLNNATAVTVKAAVSGKTHYVTKVIVMITTHANAKLVKVQDNAGSPVVIFQHHDLTKAAGVPDMIEVDMADRFGNGVPVTSGQAVDIVSEAVGVAGKVFVFGYYE
jgi:hypothetical protein